MTIGLAAKAAVGDQTNHPPPFLRERVQPLQHGHHIAPVAARLADVPADHQHRLGAHARLRVASLLEAAAGQPVRLVVHTELDSPLRQGLQYKPLALRTQVPDSREWEMKPANDRIGADDSVHDLRPDIERLGGIHIARDSPFRGPQEEGHFAASPRGTAGLGTLMSILTGSERPAAFKATVIELLSVAGKQ